MKSVRTLLVGFSVGVLCAVSFAGCSSSDKKASEPASTSEKPSGPIDVDKYSLNELNAAATALRAVADAGMSKPSEDRGSEIIGCPMTSRQAMSMTMPIKALMDSARRSDRDAYAQNPKSFSSEKGFESCAGSCSCGLYADIVDGANEGSMPPGSSKIHNRNKQRLEAKAKHQTAPDTLACAKKASWFCGSALKAYLERESGQGAD